jgi:hypothetical protein
MRTNHTMKDVTNGLSALNSGKLTINIENIATLVHHYTYIITQRYFIVDNQNEQQYPHKAKKHKHLITYLNEKEAIFPHVVSELAKGSSSSYLILIP